MRSGSRLRGRLAVLGAVLLALACTANPPGDGDGAGAGGPAMKPVPAIILRMVEAHGGLDAWRAAPSVSFTEQWSDGPPTAVSVEQGRRRVHQEVVGGSARMAWDGERAWSIGWQGAPPRFVAQLNYYFLILPWLTMDPGVLLGETGTGKLWDDPTEYVTVRMTFEDGVGDTPDDFYDLFIHPETYRLQACRYVVTYQALLPPGAEHTPEHILVFDQHTTVNGLVVPTRHTIYLPDHAVLATCTITDWAFDRPFDATMVAMPAAAGGGTTTP